MSFNNICSLIVLVLAVANLCFSWAICQHVYAIRFKTDEKSQKKYDEYFGRTERS